MQSTINVEAISIERLHSPVSACDGAKPSGGITKITNATHILLAPEVFRAPGGIARVSRHYLQAIAETETAARVVVIVLNDETITAADLSTCKAPRALAQPCNQSKWQCLRTLFRHTRSPGAHVTCTHVNLSPLLWLARLSGRRLTYDVVVHGIEVWRALPWTTRKALQGARHIFSVSEYTRRELTARYPQLGTKTVVLPNALDPSFSSIKPVIETEVRSPRILTVSRMAAHDWEKGIDHLIQAMGIVHEQLPEAELIIIGDGVDRSRLEALAGESATGDRIQFLGRVDDGILRTELERCRIFALPSRKEGFGLVYLEAMAAGKPCIVANAGGAPEVIDSDSGIVVPYGDVPFLADTLIEALKNEWNSIRIRNRAKQFEFPAFADRWRRLASHSA